MSMDVDLGDLDGDGDLDAFVANSGVNRIWVNDGDAQGGTPGNFSDSGLRLGRSNSNAVALGDLDSDGDLDAFIGNVEDVVNEVWFNQRSGEASAPTPTPDSPADQARAFAEPILAAIADRPPDYEDDFGDPTSGWPTPPSDLDTRKIICK
jgi:hypothetical protein